MLDRDQRELFFSGYLGVSLRDINIHLGSDSELRQIDARLNRETRSRNNSALIVRFEIVHIRARAVHFFADGVPSAVDEILAESLFLDMFTGGVINLEALDGFIPADGCGHAFDRAVAGAAHHFEYIL